MKIVIINEHYNKKGSNYKIINADKNLFFFENLEITIWVKEKALGDCICKFIKEFFIVHNFGFRQSKGYGSFTVSSLKNNNQEIEVETNNRKYKDYLAAYYNKDILSYTVKILNSTPTKDLVKWWQSFSMKIERDYRTLKVGSTTNRNLSIYKYFKDQKNIMGKEIY